MRRGAIADEMEYDWLVIRCNPAAVAVLSLAVALWYGPAQAQSVHGTSPSVTSLGFGGTGNRPHGTPPSVTSLGFGNFGLAPPSHTHHRRNSGNGYAGAYYFPYAYPWVVDGPPATEETDADDQQDASATTAERHMPLPAATAQEASSESSPAGQNFAASVASEEDSAPQPPTVLVFKDGHQVEVANYAIVGTTLYDLTQDRRWKISLSELDLPATVKENDDRGLDFQLPASSQAN